MNFRTAQVREIPPAIMTSLFDDAFQRQHRSHIGYFYALAEYHWIFAYEVAFPYGNWKTRIGQGSIKQIVEADTAQPQASHTTNLVPSAYVSVISDKVGGCLPDLATTISAILGIGQPVEMGGKPLLKAT